MLYWKELFQPEPVLVYWTECSKRTLFRVLLKYEKQTAQQRNLQYLLKMALHTDNLITLYFFISKIIANLKLAYLIKAAF